MLDVQDVTRRLEGERFSVLAFVAETGSTNADLLEAAGQGAPDGSVLIAGHQTAGRGRLDHTWDDVVGGALLLSALIRPTFPLEHAHFVTQAMGLAALVACHEVAGVAPALKWPNDLIDPDGRKLAGILAESVFIGSELRAVVVGIGLNVAHADALPPEVVGEAVALDDLAGRAVDAGELTVVLLRSLSGFCAMIESAEGRAELHELVRTRTATIGEEVTVDLGGTKLEGRATDILPDGRLVIETASGDVPITAGDIRHVRARSAESGGQ